MHTRRDESPHPSARINPLIWNYKPHVNAAHISEYCIAPLRGEIGVLRCGRPAPAGRRGRLGRATPCRGGVDDDRSRACCKMRATREDDMRMTVLALAMVVLAAGAPRGAAAAEIKVLTAGAFKQVLVALVPDFERQSGYKVILDNDTVGALNKRIDGGEAFDVAVLTPAAVKDLAGKGK